MRQRDLLVYVVVVAYYKKLRYDKIRVYKN